MEPVTITLIVAGASALAGWLGPKIFGRDEWKKVEKVTKPLVPLLTPLLAREAEKAWQAAEKRFGASKGAQKLTLYKRTLEGVAERNGISLTKPVKKALLAYADALSQRAKAA